MLEDDIEVELVDILLLEIELVLLELLLLLEEHSPKAETSTGSMCRRPGISAV